MSLPPKIQSAFDKAFLIAYEETCATKLVRFRDLNNKIDKETRGLLRPVMAFKQQAKDIHIQLLNEFSDGLFDNVTRIAPLICGNDFDFQNELKDYLTGRLHVYYLFEGADDILKTLDDTNSWFTGCYQLKLTRLIFEIDVFCENKKTMKDKQPENKIEQQINISGNAQIGHNNSMMNIYSSVQTIEQAINKSDKTPEEKTKAKGMLHAAMEFGGVAYEKTIAGIVEGILKQ